MSKFAFILLLSIFAPLAPLAAGAVELEYCATLLSEGSSQASIVAAYQRLIQGPLGRSQISVQDLTNILATRDPFLISLEGTSERHHIQSLLTQLKRLAERHGESAQVELLAFVKAELELRTEETSVSSRILKTKASTALPYSTVFTAAQRADRQFPVVTNSALDPKGQSLLLQEQGWDPQTSETYFQLRLFDLKSGRVQTLGSYFEFHTRGFGLVYPTFSLDGSWLAGRISSGDVELWSSSGTQPPVSLRKSRGKTSVAELAFHPGGKLFAVQTIEQPSGSPEFFIVELNSSKGWLTGRSRLEAKTLARLENTNIGGRTRISKLTLEPSGQVTVFDAVGDRWSWNPKAGATAKKLERPQILSSSAYQTVAVSQNGRMQALRSGNLLLILDHANGTHSSLEVPVPANGTSDPRFMQHSPEALSASGRFFASHLGTHLFVQDLQEGQYWLTEFSHKTNGRITPAFSDTERQVFVTYGDGTVERFELPWLSRE